ncbi:MAG: glycoside hydrolase family 31 protein [Thermoleophilaceae bacterium]|nr:glycoside hydrolase family 31 protein [Thermoleophilaceae bacterium]
MPERDRSVPCSAEIDRSGARPIDDRAALLPQRSACAAPLVLRAGPLAVTVALDPLSLTVARGERGLVSDLRLWVAEGRAADQFVQITEGVLDHEEIDEVRRIGRAEVVARDPLVLRAGDTEIRLSLDEGHLLIEAEARPAPLRLGVRWEARPGESFTGLGARHGETLDQAGRRVRLGADRRYTGPDCPPDMLEVGGIPQGDYAPVPFLVAQRGYAVWLETGGDGALFDLGAHPAVSGRGAAGPLRLHLFCDPSPAALLRRYLGLSGLPALLPEWAYGHWKSRDVYEHQRDVLDDFEGYARHDLPLDAIVIDSPWETQYNTWEPNPNQFPDFAGTVGRMRASGVRTVVWVTPWVNIESVDGQRPPDPESERLHREPASNYAEGEAAGHYVRDADGDTFVARWWMGTGSPIDFTSPEADAWWRELARPVLELGVEGIKADDGEGYYFPPRTRFADGRSGAEAAWSYGGLYRRSMQRALDEAHPGEGVLFGRCGWSGQQAIGHTWGGDQASDFWSLRTLVAASLTAAASGFSNWSHDVGGYLGRRLMERCPKELLLRWAQFGCFTPLMQAHGRFEQEAWTYDAETLAVYREFILLHERLVPYIRAAAASAARCGLPIIRPLALLEPGDPRAFSVADAYGFGPALWVAPVLEEGAREREVPLPRGRWIDFWSGESHDGGGEIVAPAPLGRIPVYVRAGSLVVTYPADHVAGGLGDTPETERPLEATLWGEPPLGRATARLADDTRVRWRAGAVSAAPERPRGIRLATMG